MAALLSAANALTNQACRWLRFPWRLGVTTALRCCLMAACGRGGPTASASWVTAPPPTDRRRCKLVKALCKWPQGATFQWRANQTAVCGPGVQMRKVNWVTAPLLSVPRPSALQARGFGWVLALSPDGCWMPMTICISKVSATRHRALSTRLRNW